MDSYIDNLRQKFDNYLKIASTYKKYSSISEKLGNELRLLKTYPYPGSLKHHHNYAYGLLFHTVEICEVLDKLSDMYALRKDKLILAGILHDLGKEFEYKVINYDNYEWGEKDINFNHSSYIYGVINSIDESLANIVGAHMGKKEWGAVMSPDDLKDNDKKMAWALHLADMISAKLGG